MKPLAIDLFCGLGGWTDGFLAEGYDVIGFDIERHDYGSGWYPGDLVLQDVLTLHGSQFKDAAVIVASPPCQEFSYMAMPWSRAKQIATEYRSGARDVKKLTALFDACFRIAREAGVSLIVENVRGAIPWVGRSRWHYGSFHLWGDVPALMPMTKRAKVGGFNWSDFGKDDYKAVGFNVKAAQDFRKNNGGSWFNIAHNTESGVGKNPVHELTREGLKLPGNNAPRRWEDCDVQRLCDATKTVGRANQRDGFSHTRHLTNQRESDAVKGMSGLHGLSHPDGKGKRDLGRPNDPRRFSSKSSSRKAASAQIAKIPFPLARHIARCLKPY